MTLTSIDKTNGFLSSVIPIAISECNKDVFHSHSYSMNAMQFSIPKHKSIVCGNCGCMGHIYRNCNHPITSYGIITVKFVFNELTRTYTPYYLMVQRKDSLSYVEFLRGKYTVENRKYLMKLFGNMTQKEHERIVSHDFDTLWKMLWQIRDCNSYMKEYNESKLKFNLLKKGFFLKSEGSNDISLFSLQVLVDRTNCSLLDTEWGFPKGRRNLNEDDITCACREFQEETGITLNNITIIPKLKPFEEVFSGSNHVRYKHIYYLAMMNNLCHPLTNNGGGKPKKRQKIHQLCKEIRRSMWFTYEQAQERICERNVERKELFRRVHSIVMRKTNNLLCKS